MIAKAISANDYVNGAAVTKPNDSWIGTYAVNRCAETFTTMTDTGRSRSGGWLDNSGVPGDDDDVAQAANANAVVTYAATPRVSHSISGLAWSYSNTPTSGVIIIEDNGTTVFCQPITSAGAGFFDFPSWKRTAAPNTTMTITLTAGGAGVSGVLSIKNHRLE